MIEVEGLRKSFGDVVALDGVDLEVAEGTVLGLLGPNGAGKTTAVRILTTLLHPDAGHARVAGYDVVRDAEALRHVIGLAGQSAAIDPNLTGRENLEMVGRLYHLPPKEARRRAQEVLERFDLVEAADRPARTYSGGMRRRLDLGASLVGRPRVLFLDEPTTGLDPRSRLELWDVIRELVREGTTLLLTTQYLEEADRLADRIAVIDRGRVIARGTADELKARVGGEVLAVQVSDRSRLPAAAGAILGLGAGGKVDNDAGEITLPVGADGTRVLVEAVRRLDAEGIELADISLRRPTLDDVFLALTGHAAEEASPPPDGAPRRRRSP
ncbi:MAG: daunorubicin resistance protein DrrA family ABC transporter ATP-binding protein [Actinomycetota bacterium]|nr:MAG: daunorubicin resistance protein DrrA family ABC transporter ATP-binding protein [Actinomycetota bacterium]